MQQVDFAKFEQVTLELDWEVNKYCCVSTEGGS